MATKTREVETLKASDIATVPASALAPVAAGGVLANKLPDWLDKGLAGTEDIKPEDMAIPRIAICQQMSPQLIRNDPKFVDKLQMGQMFNSLTGEIFGEGPIEIYIVRRDPPVGMEFYPRDGSGGGTGIKDFDVPLDDPRMQFTKDPATGKSISPIADRIYNYFVVLADSVRGARGPAEGFLALSMRRTQIKVAKQLNGLVKMGQLPLYVRRYTLAVALEKNTQGQFYNFRVANAGVVETQEQQVVLRALFEELAKNKDLAKRVHMDADEGDADSGAAADGGDASFEPGEM